MSSFHPSVRFFIQDCVHEGDSDMAEIVRSDMLPLMTDLQREISLRLVNDKT